MEATTATSRALSQQAQYKCLTIEGGLRRLGKDSVVQKVALYALTCLAALTIIGAVFWLALRSKLKTREVGIQFFSIVGTLALTALMPVVGWAILYGVKQLVMLKHGKDVIELQTALSNVVLSSVSSFTRGKAITVPNSLKKQYKAVNDLIEDRVFISPVTPWSVSKSYDRLRLLRKELHTLLISPEFRMLKESEPRNPFVLHIFALCHLIRQGGNTAEPYRVFGSTLTREVVNGTPLDSKENYTLSEVSDILTDIVERYQGQNHESPADTLAQRILSPTKALCSFSGETHPVEYNSLNFGNMNSYGWTYEITSPDASSIEYDFHFGPGPQADQLLQGHLDLYRTVYTEEGTYKGPHFLQHNLQRQTGPEGVRSKMQHGISEANPHFVFMTTPMDGNVWKLKGNFDFKKFASIRDFCRHYFAFAKGPESEEAAETESMTRAYRQFPLKREKSPDKVPAANGFYLPSVLTDDEIEAAFTLVGTQIQTPLPADKESKLFVLKGTQLLVQASLFLKSLAKAGNTTAAQLARDPTARERLLRGLDDELKILVQRAHLGQACKQDIDRGVAMNLVTRLMVMRLANQPITRAVLDEVIGQVIGRAEIVDRRLIMFDRLKAALTALHLMNDNESFFPALEGYLGATIRVKEPSAPAGVSTPSTASLQSPLGVGSPASALSTHAHVD